MWSSAAITENLTQNSPIGMHAINDRPVAINGQVVIRPIMIVALTYDHRLLDGREAVTFLGTLLLFYSVESSPLTRPLFSFLQ
jgi:pyruvate/2-oxoglutarate dehydrogenase complex dihydrolipoamide acyltransferase (E2) component